MSAERLREAAKVGCSCTSLTPPWNWSCPRHGSEAADRRSALWEKTCVFCPIVEGDAPAQIIERGAGHVAFIPLGPHVPGHVVFVPVTHIPDASVNPAGAAEVFAEAARYAGEMGGGANIITSIGTDATQSVPHLHVHVVPRGVGDGLPARWPWLGGAQ